MATTIDIQAGATVGLPRITAINGNRCRSPRSRYQNIKPGSFIGTAANSKERTAHEALESPYFPESTAGDGDRRKTAASGSSPKSSLTNGTVAQKPNKVENNKVNSVEVNTISL